VELASAVPGRPIRSLVAEDRSAGGVRDQGPEPPMLTRLLTGRATTPRHPLGLLETWDSVGQGSQRHRADL
jgi:hypothetical protein